MPIFYDETHSFSDQQQSSAHVVVYEPLMKAIDGLTAHIAIIDIQGTIIAVNRAWRHFAEIQNLRMPNAGVGSNYLQICEQTFGRDQAAAYEVAANLRAMTVNAQDSFSLEYPCATPQRLLWFDMHATRFEANNTPYILIAHENITERKYMEMHLQEQARRFRELIEKNSDGFAIMDANATIHYENSYVTRLLGYSMEERAKHNAFELVHPDDLAYTKEQWQQILAEPGKNLRVQFRIRHHNGSWRWVEGNVINLLNDPTIGMVISSYRDITESKHAEEELYLAKNQLETILQGIADGVVVHDSAGKLYYVNTMAMTMIGCTSPAPIAGASLENVLSQFDILNEEGQIISISDLPSWHVFTKKTPAKATISLVHKITKEQHWQAIQASPILDEQGQVLLAVCIMHDMTEEKILEQRKDEFISMASHELKTPLTSLKILIGILERRIAKQKDEQYLQHLVRIDGQINTLTDLINDLLDISRIQAGKLILRKEDFDINTLVQETIENIQATTQNHAIRLQEYGHYIVMGDKNRIGQVIINLLTNAIKYSPNTNKVIVSITAPNHTPGVQVSVQDFGIGIASEHQQKIFERFYQIMEPTERTVPGLGIGLYISSEIIRRHGGRIWVTSQKGEGSTFSFFLPDAHKV